MELGPYKDWKNYAIAIMAMVIFFGQTTLSKAVNTARMLKSELDYEREQNKNWKEMLARPVLTENKSLTE